MERMATNQKHKRDQNSDQLSNLPDSLLLEILSRLNARQVAQTRILSKRWLKIWSFVPSLCFDIIDFLDRDSRKIITDSVLEKFRNFVTSFLLCRDDASHIHTFLLLCEQPDDINSDETVASAREWILYAVKHHPKILRVSFDGDHSLNLPDCFFTCETLEDVSLCFDMGLYADMQPKRVRLPRLRKLILSCINLSDDFSETFLSGCPALESLGIEKCKMFDISSRTVKSLQLVGGVRDTVTISAPAVEILDIDGDIDTITLKNASRVTRATFFSTLYDVEYEYSCNLLSSLSSVEHLVINTERLKKLLERELPKCPSFLSLKSLTLGRFSTRCAFDAVSSFLDHCPKLEKLTLLHNNEFYEADEDHSGEESGEKLEQIKGFPCEGLQMVEIRYYHLNCSVQKLVRLILQRTRKINGVQVIVTEHVGGGRLELSSRNFLY